MDAIKTTFRKRSGPNRKFIFLLFVMLAICESLFHGENSIAYFYVRTRYGWDQTEYSNYLSITTIVAIVGKVKAFPMCHVRNLIQCFQLKLDLF